MAAVGGEGIKEGIEEEAMIPETLFYHNDHVSMADEGFIE